MCDAHIDSLELVTTVIVTPWKFVQIGCPFVTSQPFPRTAWEKMANWPG